jgi:hypothetical protein
MAMQFDRPAAGQGAVLAFRRPSNGDASLALSLRGIDTRPSARYQIRDYNAGTQTTMRGSALAHLSVSLDAGRGTSLSYQKITA